ncbi:hypothetical protein ACFLSY_05985 [Bacteroidota bacterium]
MNKKNLAIVFFIAIIITSCGTPGPKSGEKWIAMHFLNYNSDEDLQKLGQEIIKLADKGVNVCILEVDYHFNYNSYPELRHGKNTITRKAARKFAGICNKMDMKLFIEFQCLGHQSWAEETFPLLTVYPEFDITPGEFPNNEGLYCREWDPLNPKINEIVFSLLGELIDAFNADGIHVGMDEIFLLGSEKSPSTIGKDPAVLYARVVNELFEFIGKEKKIEMLMWADRFIDSKVHTYGEWEASANGTAPAIDMIPREIIMCDWHYEPLETYQMESYSSIPMFLEKGFRVLPTSWRNVEVSKALINNSLEFENDKMLGHLFTAWAKYRDPLNYDPLVAGIELLKNTDK